MTDRPHFGNAGTRGILCLLFEIFASNISLTINATIIIKFKDDIQVVSQLSCFTEHPVLNLYKIIQYTFTKHFYTVV